MENRFLLLISLFIVNSCFLQAQRVKELQGKVSAQGKDVIGVVVRNINAPKAAITDENGNFTIPVKQNDTLMFLAVQFKNKIVAVTPEIFNANLITVPLEEFVNELDEVVVRPYNLSGDIDKDIQGLKLEQDVNAEALALPNANVKIVTQSERKLQEASKGMYSLRRPLSVKINPILNAITGRTKMLKNRVAVDATYTQTQKVQASFEEQFFDEVLKIPKLNIDDFMYYCEVDTTFQEIIETKDELKMWEFMKSKSVAYRKNNNLD